MSNPRLLATCSADQTCKIWRTSNFSLMTELSIKSSNPGESSRGWMWGCAFSGDSQYIVTGEPCPLSLPHIASASGEATQSCCSLLPAPSLQPPLTTWPGFGVSRLERSRESMVAIRKLSSAWPSMTACWVSLYPLRLHWEVRTAWHSGSKWMRLSGQPLHVRPAGAEKTTLAPPGQPRLVGHSTLGLSPCPVCCQKVHQARLHVE